MSESVYANIIFPLLHRELKQTKATLISSTTHGFFTIRIMKRGVHKVTWFVVLRGRDAEPFVGTQQPSASSVEGLPTVEVAIEDKDLLKMITGGMNGIKAYTTKKVAIKGDMVLARQVEQLFVKAGGVQKVMKYMKQNYPDFATDIKSKL